MKLLITGGSGFIGSNFIKHWFKNHPQDSIINLDKMTYAANPRNLTEFEGKSNYQFVKGDILDEKVVDELVSQVDTIVHFAAESHVDRSIDDPSLFVRTNVLGTYNLLMAAKKYNKRFHHISTDEVFGSIEMGSNDQFRESTPYDPSSPYSASKASSDHLVRSFYKTFGLPITISNCSNNYGPYQHPEKMIPRSITNLLTDQKIKVYGQGLNFRDWLHVEDHCKAIELILEKGKIGETYCIGGLKKGTSNMELVRLMLKLMGKDESSIEYVDDRPAHDNYAVNWDKINQELGWEPQYDLESGSKQTIDWYTANTTWWTETKLEAEEFYKKLNSLKK
ncbi:dTDP-glucose 4,6-dehydratase [bioreactor metagenome]|uniref:dTDP-glucose 4,6-dehydratase n=1 Tax=bioreactor metagenome TaxID=1076179 RepID=A0A645AK52_9ZZZZ